MIATILGVLLKHNWFITFLLTYLLILFMPCAHTAHTRSRQTPLCWALLAVPHVNPAAFSFFLDCSSPCCFRPASFCFLLASRLALFSLAGHCSSCRHDQSMSTFSFFRMRQMCCFVARCWRWSRASTLSVCSLSRCCGSWKVYWCRVVSCASTLRCRGTQRWHCSGRFWVWSFGSILRISRAAVDLQMLTWLFPIVLWCLLLHLFGDWWCCPGKWTCWRTRVDDCWSR